MSSAVDLTPSNVQSIVTRQGWVDADLVKHTSELLTAAKKIDSDLARLKLQFPTAVDGSPVTTLPAGTGRTEVTQDQVSTFAGLDYSGLEDFTVGLTPVKDAQGIITSYTLDRPSEAELLDVRNRGVTYLRIALMRGFNENGAAERLMAQRVAKVFGRAFSTHRHTYGKDGRPVNGEPQGPQLTKQQVVDQALKDVKNFGDIPGWFFLGMNEPAFSGNAAAWIDICVAEYDAIRATGYTGLIVSSIPGNSMGGASSQMGGIPDRMINDPFWTYGGSMYPTSLGDYGYRSSEADLDAAAAKQRWDHPKSFLLGMASWVKEGPQAQRINRSGPLKDKVPLVTESAFSQVIHTAEFVRLARLIGMGVCLWSTGANPNWAINGTYRQAVRDGDITALTTH